LSIYSVVIKQYKKLIFSNHRDLINSVEIIKKNDFNCTNNYYWDYICSKFNQPLLNSLDTLTNLTAITFGDEFNKPLENSLNKLTNLTEITFGLNFNQPLANSLIQLINLTHLTFGYAFNKSLSNSLDQLENLTYLSFGHYFSQSLENILLKLTNLKHLVLGSGFGEFNQELFLPPNIKILTVDCCNNNLIDSLPNSIEQLILGINFFSPLDNLPNSIQTISFDRVSLYNYPLDNLPRSLKLLELPYDYDIRISNIPTKCKIVYL
jgi:hypothetical protein